MTIFTENGLHAADRYHGEGKGGELTLRIRKEGENIVIEMTDNGYGIEAKVLKQLFQVPTTTKGSLEGTGLGLYRIRQIVDTLKGKAWAESEGKGKGARFIAELPIYTGGPSPDGTIQPQANRPRRRR